MPNFGILLLSTSLALAAEPALTIYNQNFAVVRETIPLALRAGPTSVRFAGATAYLEPDSVILRDPSGRVALQILEQNYRADPVSSELLLSLYEGKTLDFLVQNAGQTQIVKGKIIRSGYAARGRGDPRWGQTQQYQGPGMPPGQPIIEVEGKLRFQLPGMPLFPALGDDTIVQPTMDWTILSAAAAKLDAELCYITGGMNWESDYNIISPGTGDALEVIGWVTIENQSGKTFENTRIKLMAGDVSKLQPRYADRFRAGGVAGGVIGGVPGGVPPVTEKTFDEYHLYTLPRPATLHDRETKQVEFLRAAGVKSKLLYVYDGLKIDTARYGGWVQAEQIRGDSSYGTQSNPKVWVMREFVNSEANHLGMPLPKGRVRFYRRDSDGRLEFTGEDTIQHTPRDETIRAFTGAAFDLVGERRRTNFRIDHGRSTAEESFEIKVRNRKREAVDVKVVEHLYRWSTWEIHTNSSPFTKTDSQTVEFPIQVLPGDEKTVVYAVRYTW